jgi:hypothetical protein
VDVAAAEAAVSEAAVFAAVAGVGVVAEVGAAASGSEAEVAISATAGVATSARIDRGSIGVIFTHDPNRTREIRCVGRSGALIFWRLRINSDSLCGSHFAASSLRSIDLHQSPMRSYGSRRLLQASIQKQNPAGSEPTGFSRKDDRRRVLARWPVKDLLCD